MRFLGSLAVTSVSRGRCRLSEEVSSALTKLMRGTFSGLSTVMTIERRSSLNQERAQMVRTVFGVNDHDERTPRRNGNEIGMRDGMAFSADHADFVRHKRHGTVEFANGTDDHDKPVTATVEFGKYWR